MRSQLVAMAAVLALAGCGKAAAPPAGANAATNPAVAVQPSPAANVAVAAPGSDQASQPGVSDPAAPTAAGPSAVDIQFQRGANCWKYVGAAATFNGRFTVGQRLDISSTGEQSNGDENKTWYETKPRSVDIGPPGGQLLTADADGNFTIPADGAYQISFDPMSMVGAPGVMIVCTL